MVVYKIIESDLDDTTKIMRILETLNIKEMVEVDKLLNYVFQPRYVGTNSSNVKAFDYLKDYDLLYAIFRKDYNINLQTDNVQWWEFTFILEEIMLGNNALTKRIEFRSYEAPSKITKDNAKQHKAYSNMKLKYNIEEQDVNKAVGKMFKSLERE